MLKSLVSGVRGALSRVVGGRVAVLAGKDHHGNSYFLAREEDQDKGTVERRWVKYKLDPDPTQLPVEWRAWLSHSRPEAPTPEESESIVLYRQEVKRNAKILAEEEEKRRYREQSLNEQFYNPSGPNKQ